MDKLLEVSSNPIHELELLPIYLATSLWTSKIRQSQVVWYVDNESSRMAARRGSGETIYASVFIDAFVETECKSQIKSGFSRVPSHSNIQQMVCLDCFVTFLSLLERSEPPFGGRAAGSSLMKWGEVREAPVTPQLLKEKDGPQISREPFNLIWFIYLFYIYIYI